VEFAEDHDVLVVASAGNDAKEDAYYPASYTHSNVLSVGATTFTGERWTLSNYGPNVEIMTPGSLVYSTHWQPGSSNAYQFMSGTSMAAPHASGVGALLFSTDEYLTPAEVIQHMADTAGKFSVRAQSAQQLDDLTGYGLVDAGAAVQSVLGQMGGTVGDRVWWDVSGNAQQDGGEPGIPDVEVTLSGPYVFITTTDASGVYTFVDVPVGDYEVFIPDSEFEPGGTLHKWSSVAANAAPDDVDSDADPLTHSASIAVAAGQEVTSLDIGFAIESEYEVSFDPVQDGVIIPGWPITLTLRITNTGYTWITDLPLQDVYSSTYISHLRSVPDVDGAAVGLLWWDDLTDTFGRDLGPGEVFTLTMAYVGLADTGALPLGEAVSRATVAGAFADPDNMGPLDALAALSTQSADRGVRVLNPTGVSLASLQAVSQRDSVVVAWETASEREIAGFNLLRDEGNGDWTLLNDRLIFAVRGGTDRPASYLYHDRDVSCGRVYGYVLEVVMRDGRIERFQTAPVTVVWWLSLPLLH
jgi:hypothetical protein